MPLRRGRGGAARRRWTAARRRLGGARGRRRRGRTATATAFTDRTSRSAGTGSTRPSCCSTRTRAASRARSWSRDEHLGHRDGDGRPGWPPRRSRLCPVHAEGHRRAPRCRPSTTRSAQASRWPTRSSTRSTSRASRACIPTCRSRCAAPTPGLAHPAVVAHLRELGVTAVELLPVHQQLSQRFLLEQGLVDYWGYNTIAFLAPDPRFAATDDPARRAARGDPDPARRRHRGAPRRRLQPHRRGRRAGPDGLVPRASTTPPTTAWRAPI